MLREIEPSPAKSASLPLAAPLALIVLAVLAMAGMGTLRRLGAPWPMSPWESAIVVDAWRINHGQAVYADPATDHATHMYGPLATYVVAPLERIFGPDVRIPRAISFLSAILLCLAAGLTLAQSAQRASAATLIATLCALQFFRVQHWETEGRPDAASMLFTFIALWMFYLGQCRSATGWMIAGTVSMLIGFFFKQTAIVVAIVPLAICSISGRKFSKTEVMQSLIPIVAACACLVILRSGFPMVYQYMFKVPGSYPINLPGTFTAIFELLRINALFIAAFSIWQFTRAEKIDNVDLWLLTTVAVTGVIGAAARSKLGGYYNSFLPALVAMSIFTARVMIAHWPRKPLFFGFVVLLLVDMTALTRSLNPAALAVEFGDADYARAIAAATELPGKFVCLDDPSIPLRAKGFAGRSGDCEMDANHRKMPEFVLNELQDADWVIQLTTSRRPTVSSEQLRALGFELADIFPSESTYSLWKRTAKGQSVRI